MPEPAGPYRVGNLLDERLCIFGPGIGENVRGFIGDARDKLEAIAELMNLAYAMGRQSRIPEVLDAD